MTEHLFIPTVYSVSVYILNSIHTILLRHYTNKIQNLKKFNTIEYNINTITNTLILTLKEKRELYAENYLKEEPLYTVMF